jgi:hypothetical protein
MKLLKRTTYALLLGLALIGAASSPHATAAPIDGDVTTSSLPTLEEYLDDLLEEWN